MKTLIKNALIVNEGKQFHADVLINNDLIEKIAPQISVQENHKEIIADELMLMPGIIDDQVHFREPGLTHKANIYTESRASVAGGTTSFMEMPNTNPPTFTNVLLEEKFEIARKNSIANYSFYLGTSHDNIDEIKKMDIARVCGLKIFMGSSTGNLLVDDPHILNQIFSECPTLIATHCEDEASIKAMTQKYIEEWGEDIPFHYHPMIRDERACWLSSKLAVDLAKKHNTRLHILHISTADEISLFDNSIPLEKKKITAEVCVHHLWFDSTNYAEMGSKIKCNPSIKAAPNRVAILQGLLDNHLDIIATDHAPHTKEEKENSYLKAPSGIPLVQHSLQMMLEFYERRKIKLETIVEKMCHAPAICFNIKDRGYIREGYKADLVLVDLLQQYEVSKNNILYKCGWSPFEGKTFNSSVHTTFVNGNIVYENESIIEGNVGERLLFNRS